MLLTCLWMAAGSGPVPFLVYALAGLLWISSNLQPRTSGNLVRPLKSLPSPGVCHSVNALPLSSPHKTEFLVQYKKVMGCCFFYWKNKVELTPSQQKVPACVNLDLICLLLVLVRKKIHVCISWGKRDILWYYWYGVVFVRLSRAVQFTTEEHVFLDAGQLWKKTWFLTIACGWASHDIQDRRKVLKKSGIS